MKHLAAIALVAIVTSAWAQETTGINFSENLLYQFGGIHIGNADGASPAGGLIADASGNFYGTTYYGGARCSLAATKGCGTVYEFTKSSGFWTERVIYRFTGGADGAFPNSNLFLDASGNLFGEASGGGNSACNGGCGLIFELSPNSTGGWTETAAYTFSGSPDGQSPIGGLIADASGNLYGVTNLGGTGTCGIGCGTVFELSPVVGGGWSETVLYNFSNGSGGFYPLAGLTFDAAGNLYGTLGQGGSFNANGGCSSVGCGTIFRLTPTPTGWRFGLLYTFEGTRGSMPHGAMALDAAGNLYGTTFQGGTGGYGVTFELSPTSQGQWKFTLLHNFNGTTEGYDPEGLIIDSTGNLYGTTLAVAYRLTPSGSGAWIFEVLAGLIEGDSSNAPLLRDRAGNMYDVSYTGGVEGVGTIYVINPR